MLLLKKIKNISMIALIGIMMGCSNDSEEDLKVNEDVNKEAELFYQNNLKSIVDSKCISCHEYHQVGSSRYDSYEKIQPAIHEMLKRIEEKSLSMMPPAEAIQLTMEEKQVFKEFLLKLNSTDKDDIADIIDIQWTAFKYPDFDNRVPVSGNFDEISYRVNENYGNIPVDILKDAEVTVNAKTVNVGNNEERSKNIQYFFSFFTDTIMGRVTKYNKEKAYIDFEMNGVKKEVIFDITINDSQLVLKGVIPDMNFFNWENAYDKLNTVCGAHHQNKLWNDITVEIKIKLE